MSTIALIIAASAEGAEEASKVPFYAAGGALVVWAVVVSGLGITRPGFPATAGPLRAVMGLTALLVAATLGAAVLTS